MSNDQPVILACTMSTFLTPSELIRAFDVQDMDRHHWANIMANSFARLEPDLQRLKDQPASTIRTYFEDRLAQQGYIPCLIDSNTLSASRFGYHTRRTYIEWNIVDVVHLRMYWDALFKSADRRIQSVCQSIVSLLPTAGEFVQCTQCKWSVPSESMTNDTHCQYCINRCPTRNIVVYRDRKKGTQYVTICA
jgi:hypothetical protein